MSKTRTSSSAKSSVVVSRRALPSVDRLLKMPEISSLQQVYGRTAVRDAIRNRLDQARESRSPFPQTGSEVAESVESALVERFGPPIQRVINATGVLVHTNLGRSPLPRWATTRLGELMDAYCDLEFDLMTGQRGDRNLRVESLICALTGAPAALVVNNNAAAVFLALVTFAKGSDVLLSRGEMVEIGGSFRIPEILQASGARLVEVGTTNKTRINDYESACTDGAAVLLKVNPSNYRIEGFTSSAATPELVELARKRGLKLIVDEGSGLLSRSSREQLNDHESLAELTELGVDLACGSGDKLLGGPQSGIMVGSSEMIAACRNAPLYRALRPSRLTLVALRLVLEGHLRGARFPLDQLWAEPVELRRRLESLRTMAGGLIVERRAYVGGGSAAQLGIAGEALALAGGAPLQEALRQAQPPVVSYLRNDQVHLDLRTVDPADDEYLSTVLSQIQVG